MQFGKLLEQWDLTGLKVKAGFLEMEWAPKDEDKTAAWELYIELLTRVTTQALRPRHGHEIEALDSIRQLFPLTRDIVKRNGRYCENFAKVALVMLNQRIRPFTAKWHSCLGDDGKLPDSHVADFRVELLRLQAELSKYAALLADMADIEDFANIDASQRSVDSQ